jgi:hypothetical protein
MRPEVDERFSPTQGPLVFTWKGPSYFLAVVRSPQHNLPSAFKNATTTTQNMAQAVKKKLVVCGGNGFLGTVSSILIGDNS